jgi:hypothetical protein
MPEKKPLKDPKGGLTAAGRKAFAARDGANLKPGVKNYEKASTADKKRWISWALRFYGQKDYPPLVKPNGEPTRFALTAAAWGEPVPKTEKAARAIAAKARRRQAEIDRMEKSSSTPKRPITVADVEESVAKGDYPGHPFRGNQWTGGVRGGMRTVVGPDNVEMQLANPIGSLAAEHGVSKDWHKVTAVTPSKRAAIAKAYDDMPERSRDPKVIASWDSAARQIDSQFEKLTGELGIRVQFVTRDPYRDFHNMREEVERTGTLKVLRTSSTGGHPYWSDETNDRFRAVHDAFGHLGTGRGFDRHGEEAAYQAHRSMFSRDAHLALATELRGQNNALIQTGEFQVQKIGALPETLRKFFAIAKSNGRITSDDDNAYEVGRSHHVSGGRHFANTSTPKRPVPVADVEESVTKAMTPMQREQRRNAGRSSAARRTKGVGGNGSKKKSGPPQATKKRRGDRKVVVSEQKAKRLMDTARKRGLKIDSRGAEGRADIVLPSGRRIKVMVK